MLLEGHQLGHYRLTRQIGSGGMGTVFLAEDTHMPRQVAVKVVRTGDDDMPHTRESAQRILRSFQREMRAIVQLDHPHILPVFDFGQETVGEATYTYLTMLYRPEGSLSDWLRQPQIAAQLSLANAAQLFTQAAQALQHAHARGIVHQDVKPSNFLVRVDTTHPQALPDLLLADFGIARFSSTTTTQSQSHNVRGTPMFMSPEQWDGKPGPASDQYALAIMAFRLLTGQFPFQGTMGQVMRHHYMTQPPTPSHLNQQLNTEIDNVILRALAKEPMQRFPDILAFASAFAQAVREPENLQHVLIAVHALDDTASSSRSEQYLTASVTSASEKPALPAASQSASPTNRPIPGQAPMSAPPLDESTPKASQLPGNANDDARNVPFEDNEISASAHYFMANDETTFITPNRSASTNNAPVVAAFGDLASAVANDDSTFIKPDRSTSSNNSTVIPPVPPTTSLATAHLTPATQAISTVLLNQQQTHTVSRKYSPLQKGLVVALLALIILAGSGILLYKALVTSKDDITRAQFSLTTQTIHTPAGNVTVTIVTTATHTTGRTSTPTSGSTPAPGSTSVPGAGPQATSTPTSPSGSPSQPTATPAPASQPTPTPVPPAPTPIPPTPIPPTPIPPTPVPGCTITPWSLNLHSQSNGGTVHTVTNYCNRTVWLKFTQAPTYTTDLQICFGSSNCTGWNSSPSSNVGVFIEFGSQLSVGAGFTINARCHGGGTCPSIYTVYGQAKY